MFKVVDKCKVCKEGGPRRVLELRRKVYKDGESRSILEPRTGDLNLVRFMLRSIKTDGPWQVIGV